MLHMYLLVVTAPPLTNAAMWAGIVGFLSPLAIQYATKISTNPQVQATIAFVFCLVVAAGTAYFAPNSSLTLHDWVKSALIVITLALTTYESFWKPMGVTPSTTGGTKALQ